VVARFQFIVAVALGFIALAGVAAETGVIMLIYLNRALTEIKTERASEGRLFTHADLHDATMRGHRRPRAAQDDDGRRHHGRAIADHVEHRQRLGSNATHRRADDRRNGGIHGSNLESDPGLLSGDQGHGDPIAAPRCRAASQQMDMAQ
jgi:hypothetical protein